jgi:hypothetical protein
MRIAIVVAALALTACGNGKDTKTPPPAAKPLTAQQRDSVRRARNAAIGGSRIPGASGVTKAQQAADAESKRMASLDTIH